MVENDLIGNVDPVQYTIRLLVPEGSLLLERDGRAGRASTTPTRCRTSGRRRLDELQRRLAAIAEAGADEPPANVFYRLRCEVFGGDEPQILTPAPSRAGPA